MTCVMELTYCLKVEEELYEWSRNNNESRTKAKDIIQDVCAKVNKTKMMEHSGKKAEIRNEREKV